MTMHQNYLAETHKVENQPTPLTDYNLFEQDQALQDSIINNNASWSLDELNQFGKMLGSQEVIELGFHANQNKPELFTHDQYGNRIDEVRFHPAYHQLMQLSIEQGLHSSHWTDPKPGAHVARAAGLYLMSQIEAAHICPITMTSAAIPALAAQPEISAAWSEKIMRCEYDPRNMPDQQKHSLTIGMAMTEKQGGSDVRANTTRAYPIAEAGSGKAYELVGHKYFVSAPMSDAFLVLAQTEQGLSCFLLPRWRPDGTKNPMQIQRLKNKMGNVANASSETELRGAYALMIGEDGRGVATIIEMVNMTRFDCMIGSTAGMRAAVAQATHHCRMRSAFGKKLQQQSLMQNVLTDLIIEHEAALALTMRIGKALDQKDHQNSEKMLARIGTAIGKYWICKRTPAHAYEAMECIGGSGVMEDSIMPRLFRESPINSIWEGSGNVQCLDILRACQKSPAVLDALITELQKTKNEHPLLKQFIQNLNSELAQTDNMEYRARNIAERMALALQGTTLAQVGSSEIFDAFCRSRLDPAISGRHFGGLTSGINCRTIIQRATPES